MDKLAPRDIIGSTIDILYHRSSQFSLDCYMSSCLQNLVYIFDESYDIT